MKSPNELNSKKSIYNALQNKAFIDISLRPGVAMLLVPYGSLWPNMMSSIILEVHNTSQRRQRRTEPRPQRICIKKFVKIDPAVPEICSQTDRLKDRQTDTQTDKLIAKLCSPTSVPVRSNQ